MSRDKQEQEDHSKEALVASLALNHFMINLKEHKGNNNKTHLAMSLKVLSHSLQEVEEAREEDSNNNRKDRI